jgi:transcriptional regulator with XRE-family HTH domain
MAFNQKLAKEIGNRLRVARQKAGYDTLISFTSKNNIPRSTYNQYEIGDRLLCVEYAISFSKLFNTNLIWLLTGNGISDITDVEIFSLINYDNISSSLLSEKEFIAIINGSKKKQNKIKDNSIQLKARNVSIDLVLLQEILAKVYSLFELFDNKINHNDLAYLACCIYADITKLNLNQNKVNRFQVLDAITTALRKYLSKSKKAINF